MQTRIKAPSLRSQLKKARNALQTTHNYKTVTTQSMKAAKLAAAGLLHQPKPYIKQHKNDTFVCTVPASSAEHLWKYANEEMFLSRVIEKVTNDTVMPYDIIMKVETQMNDAPAQMIPVPSVLNAPVFMNATKTMFLKVLTSIFVTGFAVIAIPKDLPASLLGDMALSGTSAAADSELRLDRTFDRQNLLPCIVLGPHEGDIQVYICAHTCTREYRFVAQSQDAVALQSAGYRFEVYRPSQGMFGSDYISSSLQKQPSFTSAISQLYPTYAKLVVMEAAHNSVVMDRARSVFVEQVTATLGDDVDKTIKDTVDEIAQKGSYATENLVVNGKKISYDAHRYILHVMERSLWERGSAKPVTNMENCDDDLVPPTTAEQVAGVPHQPVHSETKTLSGITYDFLKKTEWQSMLAYQRGKDFLNRESVERPPGVAVVQLQKAEYVGRSIDTLVNEYQDAVLARFSMSRLLFGTAGGRSTTTVGGASSFKGKNTQEVAVGLEERLYMERIHAWQSEMTEFMQWLYITAISEFDAVALKDLFARETKAAQKSHDSLVELVEEYERIVMQLDPNELDEDDELDEIEYSPLPPASQNPEEDMKRQSIYMKKDELREMMSKRMNLSFSAYAKTAQWLFILALSIYGNTYVKLEFKAKESNGAKGVLGGPSETS